MGVVPSTGLNTINNILKLAKVQIPVDGPIVSYMTSFLVAREMNMLFRQLRREDRTLNFEDLDELPEDLIDKICYKRGINLNQTLHEQKEDLKLWLSISNQSNVPHSLLLVARALDFKGNMFSIKDDETQD